MVVSRDESRRSAQRQCRLGDRGLNPGPPHLQVAIEVLEGLVEDAEGGTEPMAAKDRDEFRAIVEGLSNAPQAVLGGIITRCRINETFRRDDSRPGVAKLTVQINPLRPVSLPSSTAQGPALSHKLAVFMHLAMGAPPPYPLERQLRGHARRMARR